MCIFCVQNEIEIPLIGWHFIKYKLASIGRLMMMRISDGKKKERFFFLIELI